MKTFFWALLCSTLCTCAMQKLNRDEINHIQEIQKELIQQLEQLKEQLEIDSTNEEILELWQAAEQQLRDVKKVLGQ